MSISACRFRSPSASAAASSSPVGCFKARKAAVVCHRRFNWSLPSVHLEPLAQIRERPLETGDAIVMAIQQIRRWALPSGFGHASSDSLRLASVSKSAEHSRALPTGYSGRAHDLVYYRCAAWQVELHVVCRSTCEVLFEGPFSPPRDVGTLAETVQAQHRRTGLP